MREQWENYQRDFWKKYLFLENKVIETEKYVEFDQHNFQTYSNTYEELLIVICTEIELVFKEWIGVKSGNINEFINKLILPKHKDVNFNRTVSLNLTDIKLEPFKEVYNNIEKQKSSEKTTEETFKSKEHLKWWNSYNQLKHNKSRENRRLANLENVLNALAALYILECLRIKDIANYPENVVGSDDETCDCPYHPSKMFESDIETTRHINSSGTMAIDTEEIDGFFGE